MKRKLISMLLCLVLLAALPLAVRAETVFVIDDAELLTDQEEIQLEEKALSLQDEYGMDVVILTVATLDGASAMNYADDYYDYNGYGEDGVLFLLAMEEREWYISTCGSAMYALGDSDLDTIGDHVVPYLSDGDYYEGFTTFLGSLGSYFYVYEKSQDYLLSPDQASPPDIPLPKLINWPISLLIGLLSAGVTVLVMVYTMNTRRRQHSAVDYLKQGSYSLRTQRDFFLYSRTSKVRRQQSSSSSRSHRSSSGRSHGGRGGRF